MLGRIIDLVYFINVAANVYISALEVLLLVNDFYTVLYKGVVNNFFEDLIVDMNTAEDVYESVVAEPNTEQSDVCAMWCN
jgi:hypothetical protein